MKTTTTRPELERLLDPLSRCLTPKSARRLLDFKADRKLQARVDTLAGKCEKGTLSLKERGEYENYVHFSTFIALLKSKARVMLSKHSGE